MTIWWLFTFLGSSTHGCRRSCPTRSWHSSFGGITHFFVFILVTNFFAAVVLPHPMVSSLSIRLCNRNPIWVTGQRWGILYGKGARSTGHNIRNESSKYQNSSSPSVGGLAKWQQTREGAAYRQKIHTRRGCITCWNSARRFRVRLLLTLTWLCSVQALQ